MKTSEITKEIEKELKDVLDKIDSEKTSELIDLIANRNKVFLTGSGRSKLVAEAFAMRLTQLGLQAEIVGLPTTPAALKDDMLIVVSGSGETETTYEVVENAKEQGLFICCITASLDSKIADKSDLVIELKTGDKEKTESIEPLGSLFEQAALLYLDSIVVSLMEKLGISEEELRKRHASLE
ncbi:6-phospho-3-hexuloisomerase [Nanoarchaeota archaeon]